MGSGDPPALRPSLFRARFADVRDNLRLFPTIPMLFRRKVFIACADYRLEYRPVSDLFRRDNSLPVCISERTNDLLPGYRAY